MALNAVPATVANPTAGAVYQAPMVNPPAAAVYQAPVMAAAIPAQAAHMDRATPAVDLTSALANANLSDHEAALRGAGVTRVEDIQDLKEEDCINLGMKKLEAKRLMRLGPQTV